MGAGGNNPYSRFGNLVRTATLLDESGNTSFPGTVTASAFSGNAATATKLATAKNIGLSGVTATAQSFEISANERRLVIEEGYEEIIALVNCDGFIQPHPTEVQLQ